MEQNQTHISSTNTERTQTNTPGFQTTLQILITVFDFHNVHLNASESINNVTISQLDIIRLCKSLSISVLSK